MDMSWDRRTSRLREAAVNPTAVAAFLIVVLMAVLLAAPGHTVSAIYLNDLMVFLDGGHRVVSGQIPHRDFHAPLGPLVSLMPAAGLLLTGSLGAAMPAGVALLMVLLAPVIAHVLSSRLRPVLALAMAVYLALILAAPANLGENPKALSFAMFYNRICWVTLSLLLIMCLPPIRRASLARDGCSAALLALVTLYTKASFELVALVVLALMLLVREQRPWATIALSTTAVLTLLLEIMWGLPSAYISDLAQTAYATGAVQGGSVKLSESFAANWIDYAAFALAAGLATFVLRDGAWRCFLPSARLPVCSFRTRIFNSTGLSRLPPEPQSRPKRLADTRRRRSAACRRLHLRRRLFFWLCFWCRPSSSARLRLARIYGSPAPSPRIALPYRGSTG